MARLDGKVALITGAALSGGQGACEARLFAAEGATVVLADVRADAGEEMAAAIGSGASFAHLDVTNADAWATTITDVLHRHERLDVLVNNAALRNNTAISDTDPAEWEAVVSVNLLGAVNYCKAALPALRRSGRASVVNVSSCYAVTGRKGMGIYDATKAALLALTRTLAFEESPHGVRVNAVCPGSTLTDFHMSKAKAAGKSVEVLMTERTNTSLLGRWAAPREIAYPILWMASDEASFITGATLMVDGGLSIM
jgi:meso-butanediol dehydrogenase/(S,S)-butanediol dehydrogenase/diacetyl reductase